MNATLKKIVLRCLLTAAVLTAVFVVFDRLCPVSALTGFACPTCGVSRALYCALKADFRAAFSYHPLWFFMPVICAAFFIDINNRNRKTVMAKNIILIVISIAFITIYIIRLIGHTLPEV